MNTCGSHTAAYQTIGGGSIGGQAVITAGYPSQGGGGIAALEYEHPTTGKRVSKAEISLLLEEEDGRGLVSRRDRRKELDLFQNNPEEMYPARDRWGTWKHEIRGYRLSLNGRDISELVEELKAKAKEEEGVGQQLEVTAITETLVGKMLSHFEELNYGLLDPKKRERFTELKNKLDKARRRVLKYTKKKMYKNYQEFEVLPQDLTRYFQKILDEIRVVFEYDESATQETPPPPPQGGGGKKRRSSKRRKVKRSVKRSARRSTKRSTRRRSMKRRSTKRSTRRRSMKRRSAKRSTRRRS